MPVQWQRPSRRPLGPSFLRFPPDRIVIILCRSDEFPVLTLHTLNTPKYESFPCLGDECRIHHLKRFPYSYAPCVFWNEKQRCWIPAILPVGDPSHSLANGDFEGRPIEVGRVRPPDTTRRLICLRDFSVKEYPPPANPKKFDVRPPIMRRYGLFDEADRLEREPYYEQRRLGFYEPPDQEDVI